MKDIPTTESCHHHASTWWWCHPPKPPTPQLAHQLIHFKHCADLTWQNCLMTKFVINVAQALLGIGMPIHHEVFELCSKSTFKIFNGWYSFMHRCTFRSRWLWYNATVYSRKGSTVPVMAALTTTKKKHFGLNQIFSCHLSGIPTA